MTLCIDKGPALRDRTTLKLGGDTLAEVRAQSMGDWEKLPGELDRLGGTPLVLGWGSNILACDGDLPLVLLSPTDDLSPRASGTVDGGTLVRCGASVRLPLLLAWAVSSGLGGLEGLAGIPGSVGGAISMNAGSYGFTMGPALRRVRVFSPSQGVVWVDADSFEFGYRTFRFLGDVGADAYRIILEAELLLRPSDAAELRAVMKDCIAKKSATQPVREASAGCVFRNPEGESAGKLLDQAGFKGMRLGGMGFSSLHANFLINHGSGTSAQALELIGRAKERVAAMSGHELETEVEVVGCP